jgi:hypothetical protein
MTWAQALNEGVGMATQGSAHEDGMVAPVGMWIMRTSLFTDITRTLWLPVTPAQVAAWTGGMVIQKAMPHLSAVQREFLISGATEEEWERYCKDEEDEEPLELHPDEG